MRMRMSTQILPQDGCRRAFSGGKKASFYKGAGHRWIIPRKASVSEEASEQFRDPGQDQFGGTGKPGLEGHCSLVPHGLEGGADPSPVDVAGARFQSIGVAGLDVADESARCLQCRCGICFFNVHVIGVCGKLDRTESDFPQQFHALGECVDHVVFVPVQGFQIEFYAFARGVPAKLTENINKHGRVLLLGSRRNERGKAF